MMDMQQMQQPAYGYDPNAYGNDAYGNDAYAYGNDAYGNDAYGYGNDAYGEYHGYVHDPMPTPYYMGPDGVVYECMPTFVNPPYPMEMMYAMMGVGAPLGVGQEADQPSPEPALNPDAKPFVPVDHVKATKLREKRREKKQRQKVNKANRASIPKEQELSIIMGEQSVQLINYGNNKDSARLRYLYRLYLVQVILHATCTKCFQLAPSGQVNDPTSATMNESANDFYTEIKSIMVLYKYSWGQMDSNDADDVSIFAFYFAVRSMIRQCVYIRMHLATRSVAPASNECASLVKIMALLRETLLIMEVVKERQWCVRSTFSLLQARMKQCQECRVTHKVCSLATTTFCCYQEECSLEKAIEANSVDKFANAKK